MRKGWNILLVFVLLISLLAPAAADAAAAPAAKMRLNGRVTGVAGQAVAEASVDFYQFGVGRVGTVRTAADGSFSFPLPDDSQAYWVRIWANGYKVAETTWVPGSSRFLPVAAEPLHGAAQVRVVDAVTGKLLANNEVDVELADRGRVDAATGTDRAVTLTVPAGRDFLLRATAPGYAPLLLQQAGVAGGSQRPLTVELSSATGVVTGLVAAAADGSALANAKVQAVRTGYGVVAEATTNVAGSFRFNLPAPAEYKLIASAPDQTPLMTASFTLAAGSLQDFSGEQRLLLTRATGELSGRLVDEEGHDMAGVTVSLERKPFGVVATAETDGDGRFRFANLPVGAGVLYRVQYGGNRDLHGNASDWVELSERVPTVITLLEPKNDTAGLGDGTLAGKVALANGQVPSDVKVELWNNNEGRIDTTTPSGDGSFRFKEAPGTRGRSPYSPHSTPHYLKVTGSGIFPTTLGGGLIDVIPDQEVSVAVTVYPTQVTASGRVVDDDGLPVADAVVTLKPQTGTGTLGTRTDADGRWKIENANPLATYQIEASAPGFFPNTAAGVVLDPTGVTTRDFTLHSQSATLSGLVGDSFGKPVAGATVSAWSPTVERTALTDADGRYSLTVPAGDAYLLTATMAGAASGLEEDGTGVPVLVPSPGQRLENTLTLRAAAGSIAGTAVYESGDLAPWLPVDLVREGAGVVAHTTTDASGHFQFDGVPVGVRYAVEVKGLVFRDADNLGLPALVNPEAGTIQNVYLTVVNPTQH